MEIENNTKEDDKKLTESLLDELFENIEKLPYSTNLKSMKDFHLKSLEILGKLESIENKYKGGIND